MNLNIDSKILNSFSKNDLKIFFYESGCEGTKVNITDDFDKKGLNSISIGGKDIFFDVKDKKNLEGGKIILKEKSSSGHENDDKYLFLSEKIKSRCNCSSSFSFENKLINSNKLKQLRKIFKK